MLYRSEFPGIPGRWVRSEQVLKQGKYSGYSLVWTLVWPARHDLEEDPLRCFFGWWHSDDWASLEFLLNFYSLIHSFSIYLLKANLVYKNKLHVLTYNCSFCENYKTMYCGLVSHLLPYILHTFILSRNLREVLDVSHCGSWWENALMSFLQYCPLHILE